MKRGWKFRSNNCSAVVERVLGLSSVSRFRAGALYRMTSYRAVVWPGKS